MKKFFKNIVGISILCVLVCGFGLDSWEASWILPALAILLILGLIYRRLCAGESKTANK